MKQSPPDVFQLYKVIGNENANRFWLTRVPPGIAIKEHSSDSERKLYIHNKYKDQLYSDKHPYAGDRIRLNEVGEKDFLSEC